MELDLLGDGRILFIERKGAVKVFNPETEQTLVIDSIHVHSVSAPRNDTLINRIWYKSMGVHDVLSCWRSAEAACIALCS